VLPEFFALTDGCEPSGKDQFPRSDSGGVPLCEEGSAPAWRDPGNQGAEPALPLPCLYSNNRVLEPGKEDGKGEVGQWNLLTGANKKTAHALVVEIQALAARFGLERLGFLTLTFADNVQTFKEAWRRFHNLSCNVLSSRYARCIRIAERQKSGRWHFHLLVVLGVDIQTGADFYAFDTGDYRTAAASLRSEWAFWRKTAKAYGFGRTELLPVRSSAEGIARYVGKYVSKHIGQREERDKGVRVVGYVGFKPGDRKACSRFSWATVGGWEWRCKLAEFARRAGAETMGDLTRIFGPKWAFLFQGSIALIPLTECVGMYPAGSAAVEEAKRAGSVPQFNPSGDPVWAVPKSWQPDPVCEGCSESERLAGAVRAVEMRLYAARLEPVAPPPGGWWQE